MYGSFLFTGIVLLSCLSTHFVSAEVEDDDGSNNLSNGLGDHIDWQKLDDGLALAKAQRKPLMLIIHKSWCGACKSLKPKFRESKGVAEISSAFIMVNTMDEDEPVGDVYTPDGGYIPRILFFDPDGDFLPDVINEDGNPQYKYYYFNEVAIIKSMEKVSSLFSEDNAAIAKEKSNNISNSDPSKLEL